MTSPVRTRAINSAGFVLSTAEDSAYFKSIQAAKPPSSKRTLLCPNQRSIHQALAAIAPLPENVPELMLASLIAGERLRTCSGPGAHRLLADAEFALVGHVKPNDVQPEGPFGDHYGYYSLKHDYPVLHVDAVCQRRDALWPATVVGKHAGDLFSELCLAVTHRVGLKQLASVIHPYPTMPDVFAKLGGEFQKTRLTPFVKKILGWLARRGT